MIILLKGIYIKNVKSFRDEATLNLECGKGDEFAEINTFSMAKSSLLKNILIYGANSSGKSNLLDAIKLITEILISSYDSQSKLLQSIEPFMLNMDSMYDTSHFGVSFIIDDISYEYYFKVCKGKVMSEELYKTVHRKIFLFRRTSPSFSDIEASKEFAVNKELIKNLREDVLFLTFTSFLNNQTSNLIKSFFERIYFENNNKQIPFHFIDRDEKFMEDKYLNLIKLADSNITALVLDSSEGLPISGSYKEELFLIYKLYQDENQPIKLPFNKYASSGTKHFYRVLRYISYILDNGGLFVIDEIDKHLHPFLTRRIIEMFNSIEHNISNAQLICTVHDVTLMEENLRRDQIYFINRNEHGESELYSLYDFKGIRKDNSKLKRYLRGHYGAVPKF